MELLIWRLIAKKSLNCRLRYKLQYLLPAVWSAHVMVAVILNVLYTHWRWIEGTYTFTDFLLGSTRPSTTPLQLAVYRSTEDGVFSDEIAVTCSLCGIVNCQNCLYFLMILYVLSLCDAFFLCFIKLTVINTNVAPWQHDAHRLGRLMSSGFGIWAVRCTGVGTNSLAIAAAREEEGRDIRLRGFEDFHVLRT